MTGKVQLTQHLKFSRDSTRKADSPYSVAAYIYIYIHTIAINYIYLNRYSLGILNAFVSMNFSRIIVFGLKERSCSSSIT